MTSIHHGSSFFLLLSIVSLGLIMSGCGTQTSLDAQGSGGMMSGNDVLSGDFSFDPNDPNAMLSGGSGLTLSGMYPTISGKGPFFVNTAFVSSFSRLATMTKNGVIESAKSVDISAQVRGKVRTIFLKEGSNVSTNTIIFSLDDDGANYGLQLERADLSRKNALLQYEQLETNLVRQEADLKRSLEQTQKTYQITTEQTQQSVKLAFENLENVRASGTGSNAALSIARSEVQVANQLATVRDTVATQADAFVNFANTVVYEVNFLFDAEGQNQSRIESYDSFLGAKVPSQKTQVKRDRYTIRDLAKTIADMPRDNLKTSTDILTYFDSIKDGYTVLNDYLESVNDVIKESIESSSFPRARIDGLIAQYNGLITQRRTLNNGVIQADTQIRSLLAIVGDTPLAQKELDIQRSQFAFQERQAEIAYENALIAQKDALFKVETSVKGAQDALATFLATRQSQLNLTKNSVDQANLAYRELQDTVRRLQVRSPINGRIDKILVSEGQSVTAGTPLARVVDAKALDVVVPVSSDELKYITMGQAVVINSKIKGIVVAISVEANRSLQYDVTIRAQGDVGNIGQFASVAFPIKTQGYLLPLQYISMTKENIGYVSLWSGENVVRQFVSIGSIRNTTVEITTGLNATDAIITNSMAQYNSALFYPVKQ